MSRITQANNPSWSGAVSTAGFGTPVGNAQEQQCPGRDAPEHAWGRTQQEMHEAVLSSGSDTSQAERQRHLSSQKHLPGCERPEDNSQKLMTQP